MSVNLMNRLVLSMIVVVCMSLAGAPPHRAVAQSRMSPEIDRPLGAPASMDKNPKMDSQLSEVARAYREAGEATALQVSLADGLTVRDGRIRVIVETRDSRATRDEVERRRGWIEVEYANLLQAFVPVSALEGLAAHQSVVYIQVPARPEPQTVEGQEVAASGATSWHAAGTTGSGVKVAVIDLGFKNYTLRQAEGELPSSLITQNFGCASINGDDEDHGTGVAEVVHEIAPGAQLYLICVATTLNLAQAKDYAKTQGIGIINHSVAWFNTSRGDGTGGAATPNGIVADARANGILWVNAAGNSAQQHWSGTFADADGDGFHDFAAGDEGNTVSISAGKELCVRLKWDDWPSSAQDFDLGLYQVSGNSLVKASLNPQTGTQPPTESFCYTNSGVTQAFYIAIRKFDATAAPRFDLFINAFELQYQTAAGSVTEPASSPSAFAVGAVCWQNNALEPFSSQGPTIDGRTKPDIAGQDRMSSATSGTFTSCSGNGGFSGTSAASPTVAGAAALVKQANPTFTPDQVQSFLTGRSIDQGTPGVDNQFGSGRLNLGSAPGGGGSVGGRDFTLRRTDSGNAQMTWGGGNVQTGYIVIRWSPVAGTAFLPRNLVPLGGSTTSYTDTEPLVDEAYCYLVMAVGGNPASLTSFLGFSDFLCVYPTGVTGGMSVRLNQGNTATLAWTPAPGVTGYDLVVYTFNGNPPQTIPQAGTATGTTHNTGGQTTCYQLRAKSGSTIIGTANKLCAVPGIYGVASATSPSSLETMLQDLRRKSLSLSRGAAL